jgi:hypothetical protein
VATKDHKRCARGLIECLESRVHLGPPIHDAEIHSARQYLLQNDFSPESDYFARLMQVQLRVETRTSNPVPIQKRNYSGEAAGYGMQVQSAFDHIIVSTCYEGDFHLKHGKVKISHRFNLEGRIDFVELKFLTSLYPRLNGEFRKLLLVKNYQTIRKDWHAAEAFVLPVLPQELTFLYADVFRSPRSEVLAWLVNIGHGIAGDLLADVKYRPLNGSVARGVNGNQLSLDSVRSDNVALPILEKAVELEAAVELGEPKSAVVRYVSKC